MARYYEETALTEFVKKYTPHINGETTMECVERAIRNAPTADVVPKSEVDFLRASQNLHEAEFNEIKAELELRNAEIETLKARLEVSETDVAWEIFAEIERIGGVSNGAFLYNSEIAELKKKYTEEKHEKV